MSVKSSDELRWQAESDARTMAQYQEILQDKARMNAGMYWIYKKNKKTR